MANCNKIEFPNPSLIGEKSRMGYAKIETRVAKRLARDISNSIRAAAACGEYETEYKFRSAEDAALFTSSVKRSLDDQGYGVGDYGRSRSNGDCYGRARITWTSHDKT